jgi:hypothetical protein
MVDKIYNDISTAIATLAEKLGVATEHVYNVLVRQQFYEGIFALIAVLLSIIATLFLFKLFKIGLKLRDEKNEITGIGASYCVLSVISVSIAVSICFQYASGIVKIVNPEYYAIQQILQMVK